MSKGHTCIDCDYIGPPKKRFNWFRMRFEWGRYHHVSNSWGDTLERYFVKESK